MTKYEERTQLSRKKWTLRQLEALPTIAVGQADDLKIEDLRLGVRVWLSRCGVEDGEPFPNKVTVETRRCDPQDGYTGPGSPMWEEFSHYQAF